MARTALLLLAGIVAIAAAAPRCDVPRVKASAVRNRRTFAKLAAAGPFVVVGALRAKAAAAAPAAVPAFLALLERDFPSACAAVAKFRGSGNDAVGPAVSLDELVEGELVAGARTLPLGACGSWRLPKWVARDAMAPCGKVPVARAAARAVAHAVAHAGALSIGLARLPLAALRARGRRQLPALRPVEHLRLERGAGGRAEALGAVPAARHPAGRGRAGRHLRAPGGGRRARGGAALRRDAGGGPLPAVHILPGATERTGPVVRGHRKSRAAGWTAVHSRGGRAHGGAQRLVVLIQ